MRIAEYLGTEIAWRQPSVWKSNYELFAGDQQIATLAFQGVLQTHARIESVDGCWALHQRGFWQTRVDVCPCDSDAIIATFQRNLWKGGGEFTLPYERRLRVKYNAWKSELRITQPESDAVLLHYRRASIWNNSGLISIDPSAAQISALPLAVLMGWHAHVLQLREQMAAAAA
jgi:hypothetical protein